MRPFTQQEIRDLEQLFQEEGFLRKKDSVGGITFHYYIAPPEYLPEFPGFALGLSCRNPSDGYLFFISASVRNEWKPYWMYHVVVEHLEGNADSQYACLDAFRKEISIAGKLVNKDYLDARCTFFENLQAYMADNTMWYTSVDVQKANRTLEFLVRHSEKEKKNGKH